MGHELVVRKVSSKVVSMVDQTVVKMEYDWVEMMVFYKAVLWADDLAAATGLLWVGQLVDLEAAKKGTSMVSSMDCWAGKRVDYLVKSLALQQVDYSGQLDGKWVEMWAVELEW